MSRYGGDVALRAGRMEPVTRAGAFSFALSLVFPVPAAKCWNSKRGYLRTATTIAARRPLREWRTGSRCFIHRAPRRRRVRTSTRALIHVSAESLCHFPPSVLCRKREPPHSISERARVIIARVTIQPSERGKPPDSDSRRTCMASGPPSAGGIKSDSSPGHRRGVTLLQRWGATIFGANNRDGGWVDEMCCR